MRRKHHSELKRLQDSVHYIPDEAFRNTKHSINRSEHFHELDPHMFIEDVKLNIMPIGGRVHGKKQFNTKLEPPNSEVELMIVSAISPDGYPDNLPGAMSDFVAQCAVETLLFDTSTYEIVYLAEENTDKLVGFEFSHINPFSLLKRENTLLQILPDELATKLGKPAQIVLKPERTLTFGLPDIYRREIDETIDLMSILSTPTMPDFYMNELASGAMKIPYNAKAHVFMHNVALAKATRILGWNARLMFQEDALEYYLIHRNLLFERFTIELRDSILNTFNEGLIFAGDKLGFSTKIAITGLPTAEDVLSAYDHLQKGDIPFSKVLEPFRKY